MKEILLQEFEELQGRWLIYAYTPLCGTCQLSNRMLEIVLEMEQVQNIRKMNVNYFSSQGMRWEIESVPCLLFLHNGVVEEKVYAFQSVPYLLDKIRKYIHVEI